MTVVHSKTTTVLSLCSSNFWISGNFNPAPIYTWPRSCGPVECDVVGLYLYER